MKMKFFRLACGRGWRRMRPQDRGMFDAVDDGGITF